MKIGQPSAPAPKATVAAPDRPTEPQVSAVFRSVAAGGDRSKIERIYSINPDCTSQGYPEIRVTTPPKNGQITVEHQADYPSFSKDNIRYACNLIQAPMTVLYFTPNAEFAGSDAATVVAIFVSGAMRTYQFTLDVQK